MRLCSEAMLSLLLGLTLAHDATWFVVMLTDDSRADTPWSQETVSELAAAGPRLTRAYATGFLGKYLNDRPDAQEPAIPPGCTVFDGLADATSRDAWQTVAGSSTSDTWGMGEVLGELERRDDTVVVCASDHGMLWGEYRRTDKGKPCEASVGVPRVLPLARRRGRSP